MKKRMYGEMSVDTVFHSTRFDFQFPEANIEAFYILEHDWDCTQDLFTVVLIELQAGWTVCCWFSEVFHRPRLPISETLGDHECRR